MFSAKHSGAGRWFTWAGIAILSFGSLPAFAPPTTSSESVPLPLSCEELAEPNQEPPASCVFGYVYLDGSPLDAADVTIYSESGELSATTQPGPGSPDPYFAAVLSEPPLSASAGELVVVKAGNGEETNETTFTALGGAQQVDVWLASECGPTTVGGPISSDTTWTRTCSPYIVSSSVLVQEEATLSIESGTQVRFDAGKSLQVDGVLQADGQANAMIVFTANGPGAPGDWGYILLRETGDVQPFPHLSYALIEYGGGSDVTEDAALRVDGAWPALHHLTIRYSAADGVRFWNGALGDISASHVYSNAGWGIYVNSDGLSATNAELRIHDNAGGGIYLEGSGPAWLSDSAIEDNGGKGVVTSGSELDLYAYRSLIRGNKGGDGAGFSITNGDAAIYESVIMDNEGRQGGGIFCERYAQCAIHDNIIYRNSASGNGGGVLVRGGAMPVHHNAIAGNVAGESGGGIYIQDYFHNPSPKVSQNALVANQAGGNGAAAYLGENGIELITNTIVLNTSSQPVGAGIHAAAEPVVGSNNLWNNAPYDLSTGDLQSAPALQATDNWWNTLDSNAIAGRIWDWYDDDSLGIVFYEPFAPSWILAAPVAPPTGFTAGRGSNPDEIALNWAANGEEDVAGYYVYYDTDTGYPYLGTGANEGDSPVDVGDETAFVLSGLPPGTFHVAVTAYDHDADGVRDQPDGNESWFSAEGTVATGVLPVAGFTGVPTSGVAPLDVAFTNQSTGDLDSCSWAFGDGETSDECAGTTHTYTAVGLYTVALTVTGPAGSDILTRPDYIVVSQEEVHAYLPLVRRQEPPPPRAPAMPTNAHKRMVEDAYGLADLPAWMRDQMLAYLGRPVPAPEYLCPDNLPADGDPSIAVGAQDEDFFTAGSNTCSAVRTLNHAWNPNTNEQWGLPGEQSALEWANYYLDEAIDIYKAGDPFLAYYYLGRAAHLVEDVATPAHVHGDCHAEWAGIPFCADGSDNYEVWLEGGNLPASPDVSPFPYAEFREPARLAQESDERPGGSSIDLLTHLSDSAPAYGYDDGTQLWLEGPTIEDISPTHGWVTVLPGHVNPDLFHIFYWAAERADNYDSDSEDGELDNGTRRAGSIDCEAGECTAIRDGAWPRGVEAVAALIQLFFELAGEEGPPPQPAHQLFLPLVVHSDHSEADRPVRVP